MKVLYDRHVGYMAAVCSRYITDSDDIKDILQEAFIKIFSSIEKFTWRGPGSLRAWMSRIVVNDSLKFLRECFDFVYDDFQVTNNGTRVVLSERSGDTIVVPIEAHIHNELMNYAAKKLGYDD